MAPRSRGRFWLPRPLVRSSHAGASTCIILLSLFLCAYGPAGYTGTDGGKPISIGELAQLRADHPTATTAASLLLRDLSTGTTLWSQNATQLRAPASLTKLMTALLLLESGQSFSRVVQVSARAAETPGSRMGLTAGARLTLGDLLAGMLLPSGNDAAVAVAEAVDGSVPAFVAHMNRRAAELGLTHTHFATPNGLDAPGQLTSATDLATLAALDLRHARFNAIVRQRSMTMTGTDGRVYHLTNLNQLLGSYPGADGVKTGTTPEAGENLVASATRGGHRLLAVILDSRNRYVDARALLDYGWSHWTWVKPALPPFALAIALRGDAAGSSTAITVGTTPSVPLPLWARDAVSYRLMFTPLARGGVLPPHQAIGRFIGSLGGHDIVTLTLRVGGP